MSTFLAIISIVLSTLSFITVNGLLKVIAELVVPIDPYNTTGTAYSVMFVERAGMIVWAIVWLVAIFLIHAYYRQAQTRRALFTRFAQVTIIEVLIVGAGYLLPWILRAI